MSDGSLHSVQQSASSDRVTPLITAIGRPALLLAGLVVAALALRGLTPGWAGLTPSGQGLGAFLLAAAVACAVGAPRQAAALAAGYAFGFWEGAGLAWLATALACAADFFWARLVARDWMRRRLRGRIALADRFLAAHPFNATLALRLFPVGNNLLVNLVAGVSAVAPAPFLVASLLGYLPQTVIFALLGNGVHVTRAVQIAVGVALFALSGVIGVVLFREAMRPDRAAKLSAGAGTPQDGAIPTA